MTQTESKTNKKPAAARTGNASKQSGSSGTGGAAKSGGSAKTGGKSGAAGSAKPRSASGGSQAKNGASSGGTAAKNGAGSSAKSKSARIKEEEKEREEALERQRKNVISLTMFAFSVIFLILVLFPSISNTISPIVYGLFGMCAIVWAAAFFAISTMVSRSPDDDEKLPFKCKMAVYLALVVSAFVHCASPVSKEVAETGVRATIASLYTFGEAQKGAGVVGGVLGAIMVRIFGRVLSMIIILLAAFVVVMLLSQMTLPQLGHMIVEALGTVRDKAEEFTDEFRQARADRESRLTHDDPDYDDGLKDEIADAGFKEINAPTAAQINSRRRYSIEDIDIPDDLGYDIGTDAPFDENPYAQDEPEPARANRGKNKVRTFGQVDPRSINRHIRPDDGADDVTEDGTLTEIPDFIMDEHAEVTDEQLEELCERVASESQRQHEEDMLAGAEEFEAEIAEADDEPIQYRFPSVSLLTAPTDTESGDLRDELRSNADRLISVLAEYKVSASVKNISHGPTITRYEITPDTGVRVKRITELSKEMALRLAAKSVRIEAPIPGKSAVGIEIPNKKASTVYVRSLINSEEFRENKGPLVLALGQNIDGENIFCNVAEMPHLLIAGSTGAGKSVCINSMLVSLLYRSSPSDVRLIMVDPKAVELYEYNGIPHLLVPVITDPQKAAGALQWAIGEMEKRYSLLRDYSVKKIDDYNKLADKDPTMRHMPSILIIIDELADLMATAKNEVETSIARLAAKARAAGMHLILATQRPSVDVITGTIKNNIPSRIAFAVTSSVDSRTILDESGAEQLIGKGDMLFKPSGGKPTRVQGCFASDEDVLSVVSYIKENSDADYDDEIALEIERNAPGAAPGEDGEPVDDPDEDELFLEAAELAVETGSASTSMIQRRFRVGYARAGNIIDQLERKGIIGPWRGSKPREVLIDANQLMELKLARSHPKQPAEPVPVQRPASRPSHTYVTVPADEDGFGQQALMPDGGDEDEEIYADGIDNDSAGYYDDAKDYDGFDYVTGEEAEGPDALGNLFGGFSDDDDGDDDVIDSLLDDFIGGSEEDGGHDIDGTDNDTADGGHDIDSGAAISTSAQRNTVQRNSAQRNSAQRNPAHRNPAHRNPAHRQQRVSGDFSYVPKRNHAGIEYYEEEEDETAPRGAFDVNSGRIDEHSGRFYDAQPFASEEEDGEGYDYDDDDEGYEASLYELFVRGDDVGSDNPDDVFDEPPF